MAECPKCNKEINHLDYEGTQTITSDFRIDLDDCGVWGKEELVDCLKSSFKCPKCKKELFDDEGDAMEFFTDNDKTHLYY